MSDMHERERVISEMLGMETLPSPEENSPFLSADDEVIELNDNFDFNDFQVVRREFFSHLREPSVSFTNNKFYVNRACLLKFPSTDYVQVLINQETKIMALRPCIEGEPDSFLWCKEKNGKKIPRQVICKLFFAKIFTLMGWNPDYRYKLLGRIIHSKGLYMFAFDLTSTEVYEKKYIEGQKPQASRTPTYPENWQNQFGMSYADHKQSMQINIFDGYAVYSIKDTPKPPVPEIPKTEYTGSSTDNGGVSVVGP